MVRKMEVIEELTLSDHKPVLLHITFPKKQRRNRVKPKPTINWEKLRRNQCEEVPREDRDTGRQPD